MSFCYLETHFDYHLQITISEGLEGSPEARNAKTEGILASSANVPADDESPGYQQQLGISEGEDKSSEKSYPDEGPTGKEGGGEMDESASARSDEVEEEEKDGGEDKKGLAEPPTGGGGGGGGGPKPKSRTPAMKRKSLVDVRKRLSRSTSPPTRQPQYHMIRIQPAIPPNANIRHIMENVVKTEGPFDSPEDALRAAIGALKEDAW